MTNHGPMGMADQQDTALQARDSSAGDPADNGQPSASRAAVAGLEQLWSREQQAIGDMLNTVRVLMSARRDPRAAAGSPPPAAPVEAPMSPSPETAEKPPAQSGKVTYHLSRDAGGRFAIDAGTGVLTITADIEHETAESYEIEVTETSADGSVSVQPLIITRDGQGGFAVSVPEDETDAEGVPPGADPA